MGARQRGGTKSLLSTLLFVEGTEEVILASGGENVPWDRHVFSVYFSAKRRRGRMPKNKEEAIILFSCCLMKEMMRYGGERHMSLTLPTDRARDPNCCDHYKLMPCLPSWNLWSCSGIMDEVASFTLQKGRHRLSAKRAPNFDLNRPFSKTGQS